MKRKILSSVGFASLILLPMSQVFANENIATCESCHGPGGAKPIVATYPIIAGQYKDYLVQALKDYRSGTRANVLMASQATALTDADIEELATYFSEQKGL